MVNGYATTVTNGEQPATDGGGTTVVRVNDGQWWLMTMN